MNRERLRSHRRRLFKQAPFCVWCGKLFARVADATLDHIVPISLGGSAGSITNLMLACAKCNRKRGAWYVVHAARAIAAVAELRERRRQRAAAAVDAVVRRAIGL